MFMSHVVGKLLNTVIMANYTSRYLRFSFGTSHPHNVDVKQKVNEIEIFRSVGPGAVGREPK